jgi:hypothetical protein
MKSKLSATSLLLLWLLSAASAFTTPTTRHFSRPRSWHVISALYSEQNGAEKGTQTDNSDGGEFHPSDPARTTPQFLTGLWQLIARGNTMVRGVSTTMHIYIIICIYYILLSCTDVTVFHYYYYYYAILILINTGIISGHLPSSLVTKGILHCSFS